MRVRSVFTVLLLTACSLGLGALGSYFWFAKNWPPMTSGMGSDAGAAKKGKKVLYWKSPMVAGEIHQEPGKDSMGMDLVPVYEGDDVGPGRIAIDPSTRQDMGVRLGKVTKGRLIKSVRTVGFVAYDETTLAVVSTKVDGWIEKLYVDQTGVQVHNHDKLFDLYSPSLFSAQEEYLVALRSVQKEDVKSVPRSRLDSQSLVRDARTRLEYFDVPVQEIDALEKTRKVKKTLTLHAPATGIVIHKGIVEGQMVKAGADLLRIADLSKVWVLGKVYEYDLPYIKKGQVALMKLSYLPGRTFRGRVTYVYPYLEKGTREVTVRMEFDNPGYNLKPGMYATLTLRTELENDVTLVPDVAVIDTGVRSVVFVSRSPGKFELRNIKTGLRSDDDKIQVLDGLEPGETVVLSGQFLLDSESRLREAALKFLKPEDGVPGDGEEKSGPKGKHPANGAKPSPDVPREEGAAESTYYVCPMPEHSSILYETPGDCPICGKAMKLVPVSATVDSRSSKKADSSKKAPSSQK